MKNGMKVWAAVLALAGVCSLAIAADTPAPAGKAVAAKPAAPAQDLVGVWQGKLKVDATTSLTIQFTFAKKPDGSYSATLNSPDSGAIKDVAASAVTVNNGAVKVDVPTLSGTFSGALKSGSLEGQWAQPGSTLPLILSPYQKPQMTKADMDTLVGTWNGPLKLPGGSLTLVMRFKLNDKGELQGTMASPEQGGAEAPMADIEFIGGKLTYKIPAARGEFSGTYANGTIAGQWSQGGQALPVTIKKGEYAAPVIVLKLSAEAFAALNGRWEGTLNVTTPQGQKVSLALVLRIETDSQAQIVGFIDSPTQHAIGIPITEASFSAGKLVVKVAAVGAEYDADLSGKTLVGEWAQGPVKSPLTLTRK